MAIKKNYWTSLEDYPLADFGIEFPNELDIEDHFAFMEEYLTITHTYSICKIDLENDTENYMAYLRDTWKRFGLFRPSYLPGYKFYSSQFNNSFTKLAFYENNQVVQKEISLLDNENFNAVYLGIKKLRQYYFFDTSSFDTRSNIVSNTLLPPVSISLLGKVKGKPFPHNEIVGSIRNDIWLDKVNKLKIWNDNGSSFEIIEETDNTELAKLNTPRLNGFLRDLRNLGNKYGGTWFFESNIQVVDEHAFPIKGDFLYYSDDINL